MCASSSSHGCHLSLIFVSSLPIFAHVCLMCVSSFSHVCLNWVSCVSYLSLVYVPSFCLMCVSSLSFVCFICVSPVFHLCLIWLICVSWMIFVTSSRFGSFCFPFCQAQPRPERKNISSKAAAAIWSSELTRSHDCAGGPSGRLAAPGSSVSFRRLSHCSSILSENVTGMASGVQSHCFFQTCFLVWLFDSFFIPVSSAALL